MTLFSSEYASSWYSPLELDFGQVGVGDTSPAQVMQITNIGTVTLNFSGGTSVDDNFTAIHNCEGGLAAGESCQYTFFFTPTELGRYSAASNSYSNGGSFTVRLAGGMSTPQISKRFAPVSVAMDDGAIGCQSECNLRPDRGGFQRFIPSRNAGSLPLDNQPF